MLKSNVITEWLYLNPDESGQVMPTPLNNAVCVCVQTSNFDSASEDDDNDESDSGDSSGCEWETEEEELVTDVSNFKPW